MCVCVCVGPAIFSETSGWINIIFFGVVDRHTMYTVPKFGDIPLKITLSGNNFQILMAPRERPPFATDRMTQCRDMEIR